MKNFNQELGILLIETREANGYSQQKLADKMKKTKALISYWENGKRQISVGDLWLFTECIGFDDIEKEQFFKKVTMMYNPKMLKVMGWNK